MKRITFLLATCGLIATGAIAQTTSLANPGDGLHVSTLFSDHMVLQRGMPVPVWGWAPQGVAVTVTFAGQTQTATAGDEGRWTAALTPLEANATGRTMKIAAAGRTIALADVLVGEVWLCSGQSNMAASVAGVGYVPPARRKAGRGKDGPKGIPEGFNPSQYSKIRQFKASNVKNPAQVDPVKVGKWSVCSEETVSGFTAVGFFFAQTLWEELKVPIGLINCSKGSTRVEAWQVSGKMYRSQTKPLLPLGLRGAIWYQGEHNAGGPDGYGEKLAKLITGWRDEFDQGEFPFYIVQLPNFCDPNPDPAGGDGWARIREEQDRVLTATPHTGLAVTIDVGLVDNAHPHDKLTVGRRLAQWALAKDYGRKDVVPSGPRFRELKIDGSRAIVSFDFAESGLMVGAREDLKVAHEVKEAKLGGFAIAGADKTWHWAEARIDGHTVSLSCEKVSEPVAVRYAFSGNPDRANLYNLAGLPAAPFRTDNWEIPLEVVKDLRGMKERRAAEEERKKKGADKKAAANKT